MSEGDGGITLGRMCRTGGGLEIVMSGGEREDIGRFEAIYYKLKRRKRFVRRNIMG